MWTINVATPWDQIDGNKIKVVGEFGIGLGAEIVVQFVRNTQSAAFGGAVSRAGGFNTCSLDAGVG